MLFRSLVRVGAMVEDGKFRVEKFNGQNFSLWKMQMEDYLYQKDLYLPLNGKTKKPVAMTDAKWNIIDRKALGRVQLCLAASFAFNISKETTTKGLMTTLDKIYEKPSASNKAFLMNRLFNMLYFSIIYNFLTTGIRAEGIFS